jgi:hypothetical protein
MTPTLTSDERETHGRRNSSTARLKPKDYGLVWTMEEVELMLRLEIELQSERNIARKWCQYLPGKTNRQIQDKMDENTYKKRRHDLMQPHAQTAPEARLPEVMELSMGIPDGGEPSNDLRINETKTEAVLHQLPEIIVSDLSRPKCFAKSVWRESLL